MYKKLKEISNLIGGYAFKSNNYVNAGLRVVRIANVQDGYFSDESPCYYPLDIEDTLGDANLQDGDLLMSLTGNVGRVAILPKEALPAGLNQRVQCIRTDDMTKKYLYYFFKSQKFVHDAIKNSTGIAQLNLSTTWLSNYPIPYFAREKMNYIVNELDKFSIVIDKEHNNLIKIDELIKSRFNEMFSHVKKIQTINNICSICRGASPRPIAKYITQNDGINWIKIGDVGENDIYITKSKEKITIEGASKSRIVKPGDFILSNSMSFGRPYILGINGCVHDGWLIISNYSKYLDPVFFYYELRSSFVQEQFNVLAGGSTVKNLNSDLVKKVSIHLPDMEHQKQFVKFAKLVDKLKFIK